MSHQLPVPSRLRFQRGQRLSGRREFAEVYASRCRKTAGPVVVHGRPNGLTHLRFGLSVSRRVGTAVVRNRIKRLLREAFRLQQHDWPCGYDVVIVVRPHEPLSLAEYQKALFRAMRGLHHEWTRRAARSHQGRETHHDGVGKSE